jgi:hypothetical protein
MCSNSEGKLLQMCTCTSSCQFFFSSERHKFYFQICLDNVQFDSITNCSHSTFGALTDGLLKRKFKLTLENISWEIKLKILSWKCTQDIKIGRILCFVVQELKLFVEVNHGLGEAFFRKVMSKFFLKLLFIRPNFWI